MPRMVCATSKQRFTGLVHLRLAISLWTKYARAVETGEKRLAAAGIYATLGARRGRAAKAGHPGRLHSEVRGIFPCRSRSQGGDTEPL